MDNANASTTYGRTQSESSGLDVLGERPVYFVSTRPEAYEVYGEIGREEARAIAHTIAEHASRHFPGLEFKLDDAWHRHQHGLEHVAAYIEANWQRWADEALSA